MQTSSELSFAANQLLQKSTPPNRRMEDWRYIQLLPDIKLEGKSLAAENKLSDFGVHGLSFIGNSLEEENLPSTGFVKRALSLEALDAFAATFEDTNYLSLLGLTYAKHSYEYDVAGFDKQEIVVLSQTGSASHAKNLKFNLAENTRLDLSFINLSTDAEIIENNIFILNQNSDLNISSFLKNTGSNYYGKFIFHCYQGSKLKFTALDLEALKQKQEVHVFIHGADVEVDLQGAYCLANKETSERFVRIHHLHPGSKSNQLFKGIIQDQARAIFDGKIFVAKGANQTFAEQLNKNLVLSSSAEVDTKPQLEIYADDVKCNHGATISRFLPEEVFYFQARAIDEKSAIDLLARGFLKDTFKNLAMTTTKKLFLNNVENKISSLRDKKWT